MNAFKYTFLNESGTRFVSRVFKTHHAGRLHGLAQAGSVGFTPEHVAGEISGTLCHDESEGVDVLSYTHEGQEAHPAFWQHLLILGLERCQTHRNHRLTFWIWERSSAEVTFGTCFDVIVRVAGATLTETGIQLFLTLPLTAVSSASLITSIPVKTRWRVHELYRRIHWYEGDKMRSYQLALRPLHFQGNRPGTVGSSHFWGREILERQMKKLQTVNP